MTPRRKGDPSADDQYKAALEALSSPPFRDGSARDKQEVLWGFISKYPYPDLPPVDATMLELAFRLVNRSKLQLAFDVNDDIRPPRTKAFHPFGTVAKIRFVADGEHPFTGIFASGAIGFARVSLTMGQARFGPSTAFKFLIDGPNSAQNLNLDQSLDTQTSRDFFERAPTNKTIWPTTYPLKLVWPLVVWWLSPIADPMLQPLDHIAAISAHGRKSDPAKAPELIYFYGSDEFHPNPETKQDFREMLSEITPGSVLYRVYCRTSAEAKQIYLGFIQTESLFVASEFGDRILALRHTKQTGDTPPAK